jgi:hypothetical protein
MSTELARIPDRVLPAPGHGDLPEPVALRRMIGPSIILAGLSVGSGKFVLWPRLTAEFGFVMFLYSGLLLWMNGGYLRGPLRPSPLRIAALVGALAFFGYFSVLTLLDQLSRTG